MATIHETDENALLSQLGSLVISEELKFSVLNKTILQFRLELPL